MADPRDRVDPGGLSGRLGLTVALVTLTALYAVLQVGAVRPHLPADPTPNLARPPAIAATSSELPAWREPYHAGSGDVPVWKIDTPALGPGAPGHDHLRDAGGERRSAVAR